MLQDHETAVLCMDLFSVGLCQFVGDRVSWKLPLSVENLGVDNLCIGLLRHTWVLSIGDNRGGLSIDLSGCVISD